MQFKENRAGIWWPVILLNNLDVILINRNRSQMNHTKMRMMIFTCQMDSVLKIPEIVESCAEYTHNERSGESSELILLSNRVSISRSRKPILRRAINLVLVGSLNARFAKRSITPLPFGTINFLAHAGKLMNEKCVE